MYCLPKWRPFCPGGDQLMSAWLIGTCSRDQASVYNNRLQWLSDFASSMMTSSNGNLFSVTGSFCGEFTGHRWIPRTKASDAELWCFVWSSPWINGWINNREGGGLRRNRAHYDVIVMISCTAFTHGQKFIKFSFRSWLQDGVGQLLNVVAL